MPISKDRISSPIEAGQSLLDAKQLPYQLTSALDYVSDRVARKRLHLTLIVVRKDINVPVVLSPQSPQSSISSPRRADSPSSSITTSPVRSLFGSSSRLSKQSSRSSMSDSGSATSFSSSSSLSRTQWPGLPSSPKDSSAAPPSPVSTLSSPMLPMSPNPYGITLMHATTMTAKAEKVLRHYIGKAEKKYGIGSGWLTSQPLTNTISCPATNDLIRRSLVQNEILFSSEGLTLLSLDHIYTFKCHLHTYSRSLSPVDLTLTVDELRRLVLAQKGRRITMGYLMRAYEWLGVSLAALVDVNEGYKIAYGGAQRSGGIEVLNEERKSPPPLKTSFDMQEIKRMKISVGFSPVGSRASEQKSPGVSPCSGSENESGDEGGFVKFGESAKGRDRGLVAGIREDRGPHRRGPITPNGFEDITPVTKGEWCFLMVGEGWKEAKTAPVETC